MRNRYYGLPGPTLVACAVFLLFSAVLFGQDWPQWGRTPQHGGESPVVAQPLQAILADILYDPFVEQMKEEAGGPLFAHYAVPLVDETGVYMVFKTGQYTGFGNWDSIDWTVKRLRWNAGALETVWTFVSDWEPPPLGVTGAWEAVFLPAISGHDIYVPGRGGTVHRVAKETGLSEGRVNPFSSVDPSSYVAGGLAVAPDGSVLYNVVGLSGPEITDPITGAWLVKVEHERDARTVAWATLVSGAPAATSLCTGAFSRDVDPLPWPPSINAVPPTAPCGAQRPGFNVTPAIAPDGTIYTASRAHANDRYAYLVAVHADLTPAWTQSLRGLLDDGCGVLIPIDGTAGGCRVGAHHGVDPATNDMPAGRVRDSGTSSPVVLPDGAVLFGASTSYNYARGHLFKFDASGSLLASYDFGWDITPAVDVHDDTYSILIKDNHYTSATGVPFYDVTRLDANLVPEWSFRATNTESCARQPGGGIECVDDHPDGFEWCVNQPAIDAAGTAFLNGEDGVLYAFDRNGRVVGQIFLDTALGAAYTPLSIGPDGIIYTQNNGRLFAVGRGGEDRDAPQRPAGSRPASTRIVERQ